MNEQIINVLQLEPEQFLSLVFFAVYHGKIYNYINDEKYDERYVTSRDIDRFTYILGKNFIKYEKKEIGVTKPDTIVYLNYGDFDKFFEYFPLPDNAGYGYRIKKGYNDKDSYLISLKLEEYISSIVKEHSKGIRISNNEFLSRYSLKKPLVKKQDKKKKKLGKIRLPFHSWKKTTNYINVWYF